MGSQSSRQLKTLSALACLGMLSACNDSSPALSRTESPLAQNQAEEFERPDLGAITKESPLIGALTNRAPIYSAAHKKSQILGYLHAGEKIRRSARAHDNEQCTEGWYAVAPRGFMCTEKSASTDLQHPTLRTMALGANLGANLPYTYARTTKVTALFHKSETKGVELGGRLAKSTVMAIVGSWTAPDESREPQRLGLKTDGHFVRAGDLEAAQGSSFSGASLTKELSLPLAFVVRRGVRAWAMDGAAAVKKDRLKFHDRLELSGRYRTIQGQRFWATKDERWVRHRDVTVLRKRHEFPEFAHGEQKWIDVSIITGSAIAYQGQSPKYATLVSVGRDRLGDPKTTASTERGTFRVTRKEITRRINDSPDSPLHDAPWALALENGSWLHATPRHNRFGIEHTDGNIELSPQDGHFLWHWSSPTMPSGWHSVLVPSQNDTTLVVIRK